MPKYNLQNSVDAKKSFSFLERHQVARHSPFNSKYTNSHPRKKQILRCFIERNRVSWTLSAFWNSLVLADHIEQKTRFHFTGTSLSRLLLDFQFPRYQTSYNPRLCNMDTFEKRALGFVAVMSGLRRFDCVARYLLLYILWLVQLNYLLFYFSGSFM